jgi:hypothetical protein
MTARDPRDRPASAAEVLAELDPTRPLPPTASVPADPLPPTASLGTAATRPLDRTTARPEPVRTFQSVSVTRNQAIAGGAVLLAILAIVIAAAAGGGGGKKLPVANGAAPAAAPSSAPVNDQVNRLEQIVRSAPQR